MHGLDLRHTPSVELFARWLGEQLPRLDYILNNACQTVRRPAGFFRHLLEREALGATALPDAQRGSLSQHQTLCRSLVTHRARGYPEGLVHSAALSQRRYLDEDYLQGEALFPIGLYDEDSQQVDLRTTNSWRLRLHEVQTPELLEVQLVNAIAPYILNARLKPLMMKSGARDLHIVNVSAMEGQFYRTTKTDRHPHTNMAKAGAEHDDAHQCAGLRARWHPHECGGYGLGQPMKTRRSTRHARWRKVSRRLWTSSMARRASWIRSSPERTAANTHWGQFLKDYKTSAMVRRARYDISIPTICCARKTGSASSRLPRRFPTRTTRPDASSAGGVCRLSGFSRVRRNAD